MYCQSCGAAVTQGLSYCNRCGVKLNLSTNAIGESSKPEKLSQVAEHLSVATIFVTLGGFLLTFLLAGEMLENKVSLAATIFMTVFTLLITLGISGLLLRQLFRVLNVYLQPLPNKVETDAHPPAQIGTAPEAVASVTEHTTRKFDRAYKEQNTPES